MTNKRLKTWEAIHNLSYQASRIVIWHYCTRHQLILLYAVGFMVTYYFEVKLPLIFWFSLPLLLLFSHLVEYLVIKKYKKEIDALQATLDVKAFVYACVR